LSDDAPSAWTFVGRLAVSHGLQALGSAVLAAALVAALLVMGRSICDPAAPAQDWMVLIVGGPLLVVCSPAILAGAPAAIFRSARLGAPVLRVLPAAAMGAFLPGAATLAWAITLLLAFTARGSQAQWIVINGSCVAAGLYIPGRASVLLAHGHPTSDPKELLARGDERLFAHVTLVGLAPLGLLLLVAFGPRWLELVSPDRSASAAVTPWQTCAAVPLAFALDAVLVSACIARREQEVSAASPSAPPSSPSAPSTETQAPS
jgi:hypothetical protein